mgnify:CR=1 FL=1
MRKKKFATKEKIDYMIECMLSEYADYDELLKSHNISIFRECVYKWRKRDRYDFIGKKAINEEILTLWTMIDYDEYVGERNTWELVVILSDELFKTIEESGRDGRARK